MPKSRTRDPEATKQAILNAAEELFLENGFGNTPLSHIAKKAGVTKSLIHHHFESKESLWNEIKHRALEEYAAKQREIMSRGDVTIETLRESVVAYFRSLQKNPQIVRLMAWMHIENFENDCGQCAHDPLIEWGVVQIEAAQKKGILRSDIPAVHVVMSFVMMLSGWFQDRSVFRKWLDVGDSDADLAVADELFLETALKLIINGAAGK